VFRELHVTTLGAHSPSTCEQPQGQSSFHTWLWFAAHFAASACAEVTQGEALLLDFTIEGELPASRRCACRTPPGTSSASGWTTSPKQSGRLDYAGSSSTTDRLATSAKRSLLFDDLADVVYDSGCNSRVVRSAGRCGYPVWVVLVFRY
jgi:hypothetical protein